MKKIGRVKYVTKGIYDPAVTYKKQDVVLYEGSLWDPKQETTGNAPPDHQRNEDGTPASNEFWQLFLPGALGDDYVKKTDLSKPPTETEAGKPGINYPDGKTIQMDENGMLTGTPLDFSGTWDELFAGIDSGEVKDGMVGYVKGTKSDPDNPNHPNNLLLDFDDYLSLYSSNAPQNRIVTAMLNQIKQLAEQNAQLIEDVKELRARTDTYGLSKICPVDVTDITEANGMVLGGWEKNESVAGSLANKIGVTNQKLANYIKTKYVEGTDFTVGANSQYNGSVTFDLPLGYKVLGYFVVSQAHGVWTVYSQGLHQTESNCTIYYGVFSVSGGATTGRVGFSVLLVRNDI